MTSSCPSFRRRINEITFCGLWTTPDALHDNGEESGWLSDENWWYSLPVRSIHITYHFLDLSCPVLLDGSAIIGYFFWDRHLPNMLRLWKNAAPKMRCKVKVVPEDPQAVDLRWRAMVEQVLSESWQM